jgi:hypothetical protein
MQDENTTVLNIHNFANELRPNVNVFPRLLTTRRPSTKKWERFA